MPAIFSWLFSIVAVFVVVVLVVVVVTRFGRVVCVGDSRYKLFCLLVQAWSKDEGKGGGKE